MGKNKSKLEETESLEIVTNPIIEEATHFEVDIPKGTITYKQEVKKGEFIEGFTASMESYESIKKIVESKGLSIELLEKKTILRHKSVYKTPFVRDTSSCATC